jgi:cephalosporin hydroxylase
MKHFLHVDGIIAAQTPKIENIFNKILPEFNTIIEIGFNRGAFTLWLFRNKLETTKLISYDITFGDKQVFEERIDFRQGDCFDEKIIEEIKNLIQLPGKTLVLCDGGNKEAEFKLYSPFLKPGDVIMLHDYCHNSLFSYDSIRDDLGWETPAESSYEGIIECVNQNTLIPYMYEEFVKVLWGSFQKSINEK